MAAGASPALTGRPASHFGHLAMMFMKKRLAYEVRLKPDTTYEAVVVSAFRRTVGRN
jgi:hypothetical protein